MATLANPHNRWSVFEPALRSMVVIKAPRFVVPLIFAVGSRLPARLHQKLYDYLYHRGYMRFIRQDEIGEDGIIRTYSF